MCLAALASLGALVFSALCPAASEHSRCQAVCRRAVNAVLCSHYSAGALSPAPIQEQQGQRDSRNQAQRPLRVRGMSPAAHTADGRQERVMPPVCRVFSWLGLVNAHGSQNEGTALELQEATAGTERLPCTQPALRSMLSSLCGRARHAAHRAPFNHQSGLARHSMRWVSSIKKSETASICRRHHAAQAQARLVAVLASTTGGRRAMDAPKSTPSAHTVGGPAASGSCKQAVCTALPAISTLSALAGA